jgi:hypothetical protein
MLLKIMHKPQPWACIYIGISCGKNIVSSE